MKSIVLVLAVLTAGVACPLFGGEAPPCETDANCPSRSYCGPDLTCIDGTRPDAASAADASAQDAAVADGGTSDRALADVAIADRVGIDTAVADVARPDTHLADTAQPDSATADAGGIDASGARCAAPPCSLMPDSPTLTCRDTETTIAASCAAVTGALFGQDGHFLDPAPAYATPASGVVEDLVTGLMWQQVISIAPTRAVADAATACANLVLGGHDDWRLPSYFELVTLLDFGRAYPDPALDPNFFPPPANNYFWSSTGYNGYTWVIDAYGGAPSIEINTLSLSEAYEVRCVRGQAATLGDLAFSMGTYLDRRTGLQWQGTHQLDVTLPEALDNCDALVLGGRADWRLPSLKELETIVDRSNAHQTPTATPFTFPLLVNATESGEYWTTTPALTGYDYGFWVIFFSSGQYAERYSSGNRYARCVRGP